MIEGIQEAFLGKFVAIARARLVRAREGAAHAERANEVARELHSLAGEAGLLGVVDIVPLARDGEDLARQLAGEPTAEGAAALRALIERLMSVVETVALQVKGAP